MKLIIAITGASGSVYGTRLLEFLKEKQDVETHLIISNAAEGVVPYETGYENIEQVKKLADYCYRNDDLAAAVSSGSFLTSGMIVIPCSAKTLSAVANSYGENLVARTCDVSLKERRKLVLVFRETPLNLSHIENMSKITRMGGIILPPIPGFYYKPQTIDDLINHIVGKVLDQFGIEHDLFKRWGNTNK
jgi:4-hydroxy-3-polyprenylbenzoate decarboxylase